uniref:Uncharacterized protein n=1 Tax=Rhizophora mucronata TaxID=61149 RepID=A0A2P2N5Z3_RHIMU
MWRCASNELVGKQSASPKLNT